MVLDFLRKQFVDVIEWLEEPGELGWRVPFEDQEIQNGAQLTVREGQIAAFVDEGQIADYFGAGLHKLETANLPILTNLRNWDKAFKSPFKSDVIFFSLKEQIGLKWGTSQPVTIRDAELGAIRLRAFGSYSVAITEIKPFFSKIMGTLGSVRMMDMEQQLRSAIQTSIATALGKGDVPFLDVAGNQQKMSAQIKTEVDKAFAEWGLSCVNFFVESVSLPEEVQKYLDKASSMRVLGDLDQYAKFQSAEAIEKAAEQDGGMAGLGAGVAAAAAIGGSMSQSLGAGMASAAQPAAAPVSAASEEDPIEVISKLHKLVEMGALSEEEFAAKKAELLSKI